jgi:chorismate-pyruvate lyase
VNSSTQPILVDLDSLLSLFYNDSRALGVFRELSESQLPDLPRKLLAHNAHMTETVESHHGSPVDVEVLRQVKHGQHYAREILLRRHRDQRVVQYGIVRLNFACLDPGVIREIEAGQKPLGRVLINHGVLRTVRLERLFAIEPGPTLRKFLDSPPGMTIYGRTARILCDDTPAVELLEVVGGTD